MKDRRIPDYCEGGSLLAPGAAKPPRPEPTTAADLHSQFYDAVLKGDVELADHLEGRINALIEQRNREVRQDEDDVFDTSIPGWFWWLLALGGVGVLCLVGALIWGIVQVVPPLVHWLKTN